MEQVEVLNDARLVKGDPAQLVKLADVKAVLKDVSSSGPNLWITEATLHQKIMLFALSKCVKKQGVDQIPLTDVIFALSPTDDS